MYLMLTQAIRVCKRIYIIYSLTWSDKFKAPPLVANRIRADQDFVMEESPLLVAKVKSQAAQAPDVR